MILRIDFLKSVFWHVTGFHVVGSVLDRSFCFWLRLKNRRFTRSHWVGGLVLKVPLKHSWICFRYSLRFLPNHFLSLIVNRCWIIRIFIILLILKIWILFSCIHDLSKDILLLRHLVNYFLLFNWLWGLRLDWFARICKFFVFFYEPIRLRGSLLDWFFILLAEHWSLAKFFILFSLLFFWSIKSPNIPWKFSF